MQSCPVYILAIGMKVTSYDFKMKNKKGEQGQVMEHQPTLYVNNLLKKLVARTLAVFSCIANITHTCSKARTLAGTYSLSTAKFPSLYLAIGMKVTSYDFNEAISLYSVVNEHLLA